MPVSLRRRSLHCSFCKKSESQVDRLLGGPKSHICDACVGVCNEILKALPSTFASAL
jgi:ATP-dependent protease Clp ATPase subunit